MCLIWLHDFISVDVLFTLTDKQDLISYKSQARLFSKKKTKRITLHSTGEKT